MAFINIGYAVRERIATVTIDRPAVRNALDDPTMGEIDRALTEAEENRDVDFDEPPGTAEFSVMVIGAGFSGLLSAIKLQQAGIAYTVVEKNANVGGT